MPLKLVSSFLILLCTAYIKVGPVTVISFLTGHPDGSVYNHTISMVLVHVPVIYCIWPYCGIVQYLMFITHRGRAGGKRQGNRRVFCSSINQIIFIGRFDPLRTPPLPTYCMYPGAPVYCRSVVTTAAVVCGAPTPYIPYRAGRAAAEPKKRRPRVAGGGPPSAA
jgi:hypothetical protein